MTTPFLYDPLSITDVKDWGVIPTMLEGESRVSGVVLHKGPEGQSECGIWICCLLYTSPSPRDRTRSRMPSSA